MTNTRVLEFICVVIFILSPALSSRLHPHGYSGGRSRESADLQARNSSAIARVLGTLRVSISDIMYIKAERYLDSGVAYVPHYQQGQLLIRDAGQATKTTPQDQAPGTTDSRLGKRTLIPEPSRDFRGILGHLHRQVAPWQDWRLGHNHTDGYQLLPWFRIMTIVDPHYINGYLVGTYWISLHDVDQGLRFIEEGIAKNPSAFQLHLMYGQVCAKVARSQKDGDGIAARPGELSYGDRAREAFRKAADLSLPGPIDEGKATRTDDDEYDALVALRMAVITERRYGSRDEALRMARRYLALVGEDPVLSMLLEKYLAEEDSEWQRVPVKASVTRPR